MRHNHKENVFQVKLVAVLHGAPRGRLRTAHRGPGLWAPGPACRGPACAPQAHELRFPTGRPLCWRPPRPAPAPASLVSWALRLGQEPVAADLPWHQRRALSLAVGVSAWATGWPSLTLCTWVCTRVCVEGGGPELGPEKADRTCGPQAAVGLPRHGGRGAPERPAWVYPGWWCRAGLWDLRVTVFCPAVDDSGS